MPRKIDLDNWTPVDSTNPLKSLAHEVENQLDIIEADIDKLATRVNALPATSSSVPNTVVQNSITIGATTTAPAVGTRTAQRIESQRLGDKLKLIYKFGQLAVASGSGHYLMSLPTGVAFNTAYHPLWTGSEWAGGVSAQAPNFIIAQGGITIDGGWTNQLYVVPYDATRFRILATNNGSQGSYNYWGSGWYQLGVGSGINLQLQFEIWPTTPPAPPGPPRVGGAINPTV